MNPGDLRHRITVETPTLTTDAGGGSSEGWSPFANVWAAVEPLAGDEQIRAMRLESSVTHRVITRFHAWISPTMRIALGTRKFAIRRVIDVEERHERMEILCEEIQ